MKLALLPSRRSTFTRRHTPRCKIRVEVTFIEQTATEVLNQASYS
jgi:hypothetical protein